MMKALCIFCLNSYCKLKRITRYKIHTPIMGMNGSFVLLATKHPQITMLPPPCLGVRSVIRLESLTFTFKYLSSSLFILFSCIFTYTFHIIKYILILDKNKKNVVFKWLFHLRENKSYPNLPVKNSYVQLFDVFQISSSAKRPLQLVSKILLLNSSLGSLDFPIVLSIG